MLVTAADCLRAVVAVVAVCPSGSPPLHSKRTYQHKLGLAQPLWATVPAATCAASQRVSRLTALSTSLCWSMKHGCTCALCRAHAAHIPAQPLQRSRRFSVRRGGSQGTAAATGCGHHQNSAGQLRCKEPGTAVQPPGSTSCCNVCLQAPWEK
jgi:hypothetical protein